MSKTLKPCPACGSDPHLPDYEPCGLNSAEYRICCRECDFKVDGCIDENDVIDAWNRQPFTNKLQAENEKLRGALEKINLTTEPYSYAVAEEALKELEDK